MTFGKMFSGVAAKDLFAEVEKSLDEQNLNPASREKADLLNTALDLLTAGHGPVSGNISGHINDDGSGSVSLSLSLSAKEKQSDGETNGQDG